MRKYLSMLSLLLIITFIVLGFITLEVLSPLPDSWDILILIFLLVGSFFTALFSVKGYLKIITVLISSLGMFALLVLTIFSIGMMLFGNFGT
ncbi:histidine kinase [Psychrobacillus sp.]|uniref:histidine kinase n=1 Tax=Psychrobacillus sp. TaxID=1871623 RepID=UPI0028BE1D36|nr:histidine kinase [Psychrobacillus sp.]